MHETSFWLNENKLPSKKLLKNRKNNIKFCVDLFWLVIWYVCTLQGIQVQSFPMRVNLSFEFRSIKYFSGKLENTHTKRTQIESSIVICDLYNVLEIVHPIFQIAWNCIWKSCATFVWAKRETKLFN